MIEDGSRNKDHFGRATAHSKIFEDEDEHD